MLVIRIYVQSDYRIREYASSKKMKALLKHQYVCGGVFLGRRGFQGADVRALVWSKNSCGFTRVVFQQSPKPFTTLKWACTLCVLVDRRKEQHVALALMIALLMKMRHILRQPMAERRFPKEDQARETFLLDRAHPPFRV